MIKMIMNIWAVTLFFCMTVSGMDSESKEELEKDLKKTFDCNNEIVKLQLKRERVESKTYEHYGLGDIIEQKRQQRDALVKKIADKVDKKLAKL